VNRIRLIDATVLFFCPGCGFEHALDSRWSFDGNLEFPTISPSVNCAFGPFPDGSLQRCHSFVRDGMIQFLPDSTHALAGQTVALPPITTPAAPLAHPSASGL